MKDQRSSFVIDGGSRSLAIETESINTEVAVEFAPDIAQAKGFKRLVMRYRRWREARKRIAALPSRDSRHINWLKP